MRSIAQSIMQHTSELSDRGEHEKSLAFLLEQEKQYPQEPCILIYAAMNCVEMGRTDTALAYYHENAKRFPALAINYYRIAELYEKRGMIDEAISFWKHGLALKDDAFAHSNMLQSMLKSPTMQSHMLLREHKKWAAKHANQCFYNKGHHFRPFHRDRRIRVGYVCTFWHTPTIKYQLLHILREHDRSKYEIYGYSATDAPEEFQTPVDVFRVVGQMDDDEFIQQVRSDQIDILVECTGFSPYHRFAAMASRCAPIQISYLNHTGTSGVSTVDYVIADDISLRKSEDKYFTEKICRLPGSFFSFNFKDDPHPNPGPLPCLKNGYVTFGYFGSNGKLNPTLVGWWAEILKRLPKSKLYIRNNELNVADNCRFLENQFVGHGIDPYRLKIEPGTDREGVLSSYQDIDISLDSWPYCGGNTIAEAMWQGVPVITFRGQRFSEAYGASLVTASGCAEFVAQSAEAYIQLAVDLGNQPERLKDYRQMLRHTINSSGFNDGKAFAEKIEIAFSAMIQKMNDQTDLDAPVDMLAQALKSNDLDYQSNFVNQVWPRHFALPEYAEMNRLLFNMSLKGLGIDNAENGDISGENWLIEKLPEMLTGDTAVVVFDVGTNDGRYAVKIAEQLPQAQIHAFEPSPHLFRELKKGLNNHRFKVNGICLSNAPGTVKLYSHARNDGHFCTEHASLYADLFDDHYKTQRIAHTVDVTTIDNYCELNRIQHIDFLKIDTEGSELKVLAGAEKMLANDAISLVQFEFNYTHLYARCFFNDFKSILKHFCFYRLLPSGLLPLNSDESAEDNIYQYQNIVAVHETKKLFLESLLEYDSKKIVNKQSLPGKSAILKAPEASTRIESEISTLNSRDSVNDLAIVLNQKPVATIFDIGANEGQSALEFNHQFPKSRIFSFEPFPETYDILLHKTKQFENVSCHNFGMAEKACLQNFYFSEHSCLNSISPPGDEWAWKNQPLSGVRRVSFDTIDNFCRYSQIKTIDILKVDVQGSENLVLQGASRMLADGSIRSVKLEVIFIDLYAKQATFSELIQTMLAYNFKFMGFYDQFYDDYGRLYWGDAVFIHETEFDHLPAPNLS